MLTIHHIPICPFSQRLEILVALKKRRADAATGAALDGLEEVEFRVVDITRPRDPAILALTGGSTALPVLDLGDGRSLRESLVLMAFLEDRFPTPAVRRADPWERGVENLLASMEGAFVASGYRLVMNPDRARRGALVDGYLAQYRALDEFLRRYGVDEGTPWLFERFGWGEAVFTPFFRRFAFVAYYEGVDLPDEPAYARVRAWRDACLAHPCAQQVCDEEVVKLYYDYARNVGNGALPPGRRVSSFVFEPHWRERPWPPKDKYGPGASDEELGLSGTNAA